MTGTRCTRCTPPSNFSRDQTPSRIALAGDGRGRVAAAQIRGGLVEHGDRPAVPFGVAGCTSGPGRRRTMPTPRRPRQFHLEHDVVGVVRIAQCEHVGQLESRSATRSSTAAPRRRRSSSPANSRAASRSPGRIRLAIDGHDPGPAGRTGSRPSGRWRRRRTVPGRTAAARVGVFVKQRVDRVSGRRASFALQACSSCRPGHRAARIPNRRPTHAYGRACAKRAPVT